MAISPGDSRLPLYREGKIQPVWRKLSPSKSVGLYLLHRGYWTSFKTQSENGARESLSPSSCYTKTDIGWEPGFRPEHNGIVEGIAHLNPWMLKHGAKLYAAVEARYHIHRTELDGFDFENDEIIFSSSIDLNPPMCDFKIKNCMAIPPSDLHLYSPELRQLYEKLGGPCGSKPLKHEILTPWGVLPGNARNNRMEYTSIPPTEATKRTRFPDLPYVTYNFPFRFDISNGPDSIMIKSNKKAPSGDHPVPKNRREVYLDAIYGFHEDIGSDFEIPSAPESEDDLPRIRHPREPIKVNRKIREAERRLQSMIDCFHRDSYPWHLRPKARPKAGIYWSVKVYAVNPNEINAEAKNLAELSIRKSTFLPTSLSVYYRPPPQVSLDYCLAVGPKENSDGGVITLVAKLDKLFYLLGDPINVNIKIHNSSCRVIQQINVEVIQCVRLASIYNRVWRSTICKREITAENSESEMPILPATEKLRLRCRLNPWPVENQYMHLLPDKFHKRRPPRVPIEEEAFTLDMPREPNLFYGVQQPPRYEKVPRLSAERRRPAFSTLTGIIEHLQTENSVVSIMNSSCNLKGNLSHSNTCDICQCIQGKVQEKVIPKCSSLLDEPYQYPIFNKNELSGEEEQKYQSVVQQMLAPLCARCGKICAAKDQPIYVNYEVVVSAVLRPQNIPDPLAQDALLNDCKLGSGLLNPPRGEILGIKGPRVALPAIFTVMAPEAEMPVPVANYNVDHRLERQPEIPGKAQIWEPCDGRGFFLMREPHKAVTCYVPEPTLQPH